MTDVFDPMNWSADERWYFDMIDKAAARSKDLPIGNGNVRHATYLVGRLLEVATSHVRLFSGSLMQRSGDGMAVYANPTVIKAAKAFLGKEGVRMDVLLENDIDAPDAMQHPIVAQAARCRDENTLRGTLRIRRVMDSYVEKVKNGNHHLHWMTVDECAYRVEIDPDEHRAIGNFRDAKLTALLAESFDELFEYLSDDVLTVSPAA